MVSKPAARQSTDRAMTAWVGHLPDAFILCRDLGHQWRPFTAEYVAEDRQYRRELKCSRCKASRVQRLSITGHVESTHYAYPEDYLRPEGSGVYDTASRDLLRLESVSRLVARPRSARSA